MSAVSQMAALVAAGWTITFRPATVASNPSAPPTCLMITCARDYQYVHHAVSFADLAAANDDSLERGFQAILIKASTITWPDGEPALMKKICDQVYADIDADVARELAQYRQDEL